MDKSDSMKIVAMLIAAYPTWQPTEQSQRLWQEFLDPYPAEGVKKAVLELIASPREFAPPVGVVINRVVQSVVKTLTGEEAWEQVQQAIREQGYYRDPKFSNELIKRAVDAMDWHDICANENIEATRAHFFRIFEALQRREVERVIGRIIGGEQGVIESLNQKLLDD